MAVALVCSVVGYGVAGLILLLFYERRYIKHTAPWWTLAPYCLDKTIDFLNFINAVLSTVGASWVLYSMDSEQRSAMIGAKPSSLAGWTLESVCGYLIVESTLFLYAKFRLPPPDWSVMSSAFGGVIVFHLVSLTGLLSVLVTGAGYPIAMWVIWTELTSVFLGVEIFMLYSRWDHHHPYVYGVVCIFGAVLFIFQRVFLFLYIVWLCLWQLSWHPVLLGQFAILLVGTVLNAIQAYEHIRENKYFLDIITFLKCNFPLYISL